MKLIDIYSFVLRGYGKSPLYYCNENGELLKIVEVYPLESEDETNIIVIKSDKSKEKLP